MSKRRTITSGKVSCTTPASAALAEIDAALRDIPEVGTAMRVLGRDTLCIDTIYAEPMDAGHGSRAMRIICEVCDRRGVTMTGHIVHDDDDDAGYEEDPFADGEDEPDRDDDDRPQSPSSDDLERWYAKFGFEIVRDDWKSHIRRFPVDMSVDVPLDEEPEMPHRPGPGV